LEYYNFTGRYYEKHGSGDMRPTKVDFEVFLPIGGAKTLIKEEADSADEAENRAWRRFERYAACPGHEFEARDRRNGTGYCVYCGMLGHDVIAPRDACLICGEPTWHTQRVGSELIPICSTCLMKGFLPIDWYDEIEVRILRNRGVI